jgi:hypothetical protein
MIVNAILGIRKVELLVLKRAPTAMYAHPTRSSARVVIAMIPWRIVSATLDMSLLATSA